MWVNGYINGQKKSAHRNYPDWRPLTCGQKKEIAAFWGMKHPMKMDFVTHEIMMNVKGEFDVRYCPESTFRLHFDDSMLYKVWTDKNYYERYQPALPLAHTYVRNVNGYFLDHDYRPISMAEAKDVVLCNLPLIAKPSLESGEGKNIRLVTNREEAEVVFTQYSNDYLLQELIIQCDLFKQMSPHSVASMRLITAWVDGEVKLLKSHLLCNTTESIAVNVDAGAGQGVVIIPIDKDGKFAETAYFEDAMTLHAFPNGFRFGGLKVPSFKDAVKMAVEAHHSMPMLEFVGWDVAIDESGKPVFIEWNQRGIEVYHSQLSQGPLFGEYTDYFAQRLRLF